ncbi:C-type lectin domain family 4 member A isoform X1 [Cuculus canorus]|uniref:C-type lectin domain family 4 member A n=1 Tax=Cuculus canorus TaxID=55661 RepID=A0A091G4R3_CUCCA|nr:C-type lectin domain family 4 member A isoform X1 [Cuculus canorus]XP_053912825.1 C-type lectin domain family 4 member A isoform X1 [Cuculus canorus]KFO77340.1 C-type lectin domain family 4 member A [Cuculus canorus]
MASEITYAEVKFKNASPTAAVEVPTQTKKHEHHPQKYPPWLPWLISLLLLLVCIALVILLVIPFSHRGNQSTVLQQKFMEWLCVSAMPQHKGRGWLCCPNGWKRFKKSCYYMSVDMMNWAESEQNCTAMGSHLVVINTTAEQTFLTEELQQSPRGRNYYIGLTAQALGQWQWVDQTPYNESAMFWRSGEPSNVAVEACVVIHTNPKIHNWNDIQCGNHYRICEAAALIV